MVTEVIITERKPGSPKTEETQGNTEAGQRDVDLVINSHFPKTTNAAPPDLLDSSFENAPLSSDLHPDSGADGIACRCTNLDMDGGRPGHPELSTNGLYG